jgi:hypothetical protein
MADEKVRLYQYLAEVSTPEHWPKASLYRLRSLKARVLKFCTKEEIERKNLKRQIDIMVKEFLKERTGEYLNSHTVATYRSVLTRYIIEKVTNEKLRPWQATRIINEFKTNTNDNATR